MICLHTDTEGLSWAVSNSAIANRLRGESRRGHSTGGKHQMRVVAVPLAMAMLSTPQRTASDLAMSHRTAAGKAAAATPECSWTLSSQKQSGAPMGTTPICQVHLDHCRCLQWHITVCDHRLVSACTTSGRDGQQQTGRIFCVARACWRSVRPHPMMQMTLLVSSAHKARVMGANVYAV